MSYQGFVSSQAELDPALAAYSASPDQHNWTGQQPVFPSQDLAQFPTLSGYPQSNQPPIGGNAFGSAGLSGLGHSPGFEPNQYQLNQHAPNWPISNNLAINTTQPSYPDGPAPTASQPITLVPSPTAYRFDSGVFDWGQAKQRGGNGFIEMEDNYDYGTPSYVGSWGSSVSQNPDQPESILYSEPASFAQANKPSELKFVWDRQATLQPGTQLSTDNVTTLTGMQQYREPEGYDDFAGSQDGRSASPAPSAWATESVGLEHDHSSQPHDDSTMTTAAAFEQLMGPSRNASPARSPPAPPSQSDQFATLANPAWPSISSPALSPPIISAPSVTRTSPALPQLTIPSGLEAPSLNLIQPTPASAAPRPPKGKGTLELERVLGMFTNQGDRDALTDTPIMTDSPTSTAPPAPLPLNPAFGAAPESSANLSTFSFPANKTPAPPGSPRLHPSSARAPSRGASAGQGEFLTAPRPGMHRKRSKSDTTDYATMKSEAAQQAIAPQPFPTPPSLTPPPPAEPNWAAADQTQLPAGTYAHAASQAPSPTPSQPVDIQSTRRSPSPRRARAPGPYDLGLQVPAEGEDLDHDLSRRRAKTAGQGHRLSRSADYGVSAGVGQAAGGLPMYDWGAGLPQVQPLGSPGQYGAPHPGQIDLNAQYASNPVVADSQAVNAWAAYQAVLGGQQQAYLAQQQHLQQQQQQQLAQSWGYGQPQYGGQMSYTPYQLGPDGQPIFYPAQLQGVPMNGVPVSQPFTGSTAPYPFTTPTGPSPPPVQPALTPSPSHSPARTPYVYHSPVPASSQSPQPLSRAGSMNSVLSRHSSQGSRQMSSDGGELRSKTTPATIEAAQRRRKEGTQAKFICELCGESFTRRYNLRGHQRAHRNEKPYACSFEGCDKAFARSHDCKRHELLHLSVKRYHCYPCNREFVRLDALQRHHRSEVGQACVKQLVDAGFELEYDTSVTPEGVTL